MSKGGLDSYENYRGEDYGLFVVSVGQNRDSDILQKANFAAALDMFGGESDTVQVERIGHWGCGWFEIIVIDPRDQKALETAYSIKNSLEDYPVLDDSIYSEFEIEYQNETFKYHQDGFEKTVLDVLGLDSEALEASMSKAEFRRFERDLEHLTRIVFEADCSYCGTDEGFVCEDNVQRGIEQESYEVAELECLGEYALAVCGLEINPNFKPYSTRLKKYPNGPKVLEIK
jgi:hypothetical protein